MRSSECRRCRSVLPFGWAAAPLSRAGGGGPGEGTGVRVLRRALLRATAVAICLALALALPAAAQEKPAPPQTAEQRLRQVFDRYFEAFLELHPVYATSVGDDRYNHRLTLDLLPEHRAKRRELFERTREALVAVDSEELSEDQRLYRDVLDYDLRLSLEGLEHPSHLLPLWPGRSLPSRFPQMGSGEGLHPFKTVDDYEDFLGRIGDFETWIDAAIANMRRGVEAGIVQPRSLVEGVLPELAKHFRGGVEESVFYRPVAAMPDDFPAADRERLTAAFRKAIAERLMPAYRRLVEFLHGEYLPGCRESISFSELPGGAAWYRHLVRFYTTTELEPEAIYALGLAEIERIEGEMERLKRRLRFSGNLNAFRRQMASDRRNYYDKPRQVFKGFAAIRQRVTPALPRLFNLRPTADFEIRTVEPFRATTSPGAFYEGPSADGSRPGTFYVNFRGGFYPRNTMEALFLHEALPGHHFQIALAKERAGLPRFLRFGYFGAYTEGWGLYCEGLGADLGLYRDALQQYGRLVYDLGRASRLVADVGIHHLGWSRREAERVLGRRQLTWAVNEIDRYLRMPAQALSYKVGEQEILKLRRRAEETLGEAFDVRRFHDAVLADGPLPLALLRQKVERWLAAEAPVQPLTPPAPLSAGAA